MNKIETILKELIDIADIEDTFIIDDGILYMLTPKEPTIKQYFNAMGDLDYAEIFNTCAEEICLTSDILHFWYAFKTITIITKQYKIILSKEGCNMTEF